VHCVSANPPITCSGSSSASSVSPKHCPPSRKRRNDDPFDEIHMEIIKERKEKRASKEPRSRNTHFCMEIADRLDHMPERGIAKDILYSLL